MFNFCISLLFVFFILFLYRLSTIWLLPFAVMFYSFHGNALFYFSILFLIAVIDLYKHKIPNFLILLSLFPLLCNISLIMSGFLYALPFLIVYGVGELIDKEWIGGGDVKLIFSIGIFLQDFIYYAPLLLFASIITIPFAWKKRKVAFAPGLFLSAYIIYYGGVM